MTKTLLPRETTRTFKRRGTVRSETVQPPSNSTQLQPSAINILFQREVNHGV